MIASLHGGQKVIPSIGSFSVSDPDRHEADGKQ